MEGKVFYVFKDEKAGVEYVGGEKAHRRYLQLCTQLHVAQAPEEQMNDFFTRSWSREFGPSIIAGDRSSALATNTRHNQAIKRPRGQYQGVE